MAAMMVTAGPAKADVDVDVDVDVGDGFDVGDHFGFNVGDGFRRFNVGDGFLFDLDDDDINSTFFFSQVDSEAGRIEPGGISFR